MSVKKGGKLKKWSMVTVSLILCGLVGFYFFGEEPYPSDEVALEESGLALDSSGDMFIQINKTDIIRVNGLSKRFSTQMVIPIELDLHVNIHTDYPVKLERLLVEEGDWVSKGQRIALLDTNFLARRMKELSAVYNTLKAKSDALTHAVRSNKDIITSYTDLEEESRSVYSGMEKMKNMAGVSAQSLLSAKQDWQGNLVRLNESKLLLADTESQLIDVNSQRDIARDQLNFYQKKMAAPYVVSSDYASVYKIYVQEGGDLIEYIPLFTLAKPNLDEFRVTLPDAISNHAQLIGISLANNNQEIALGDISGVGAFGQKVVKVSLSDRDIQGQHQIKLNLHWSAQDVVIRVPTSALSGASKLRAVSMSDDVSPVSVMPVVPFYYDNANYVLVKIDGFKNEGVDGESTLYLLPKTISVDGTSTVQFKG